MDPVTVMYILFMVMLVLGILAVMGFTEPTPEDPYAWAPATYQELYAMAAEELGPNASAAAWGAFVLDYKAMEAERERADNAEA